MSTSLRFGFMLCLVLSLGIRTAVCKVNVRSGTADGSEEWGYIQVRPKAHMFWWLYYTDVQQRGDSWPLILWLQGGPGVSGVGLGNFLEIGPLDSKLKPRNTTWLQKANLLFVDSPVATGFSYVEDKTLVATTNEEVTTDLLSFLKEFFRAHNTLQESPLFIVGESYGGKHASMIGLALSKAIAAGEIRVNLGGVLLGNSWISPVEYVFSWGPLLEAVSRLDAASVDKAHSFALRIKDHVEKGEYENATETWADLENLILSNSNNVGFYNFLQDGSEIFYSSSVTTTTSKRMAMARHSPQQLSEYIISGQIQVKSYSDHLRFMNGVVRNKLKIIPPNITWDGQGELVFPALYNEFMKSAVDKVDELLSRGERVTIYNGQLDLICSTPGTEAWVLQLKWSGLELFNSKSRTPIYCNGSETKGYVKSYENLRFVWVLLSGHFVPRDQPCVALSMLDMVFNATQKSP